ncbi:MAG: hypothetical protein WCA10_18450, partial [Terracidiphilus sp.]
ICAEVLLLSFRVGPEGSGMARNPGVIDHVGIEILELRQVDDGLGSLIQTLISGDRRLPCGQLCVPSAER